MGPMAWDANNVRRNFFDTANAVYEKDTKRRNSVHNVALDGEGPAYARVDIKRRADAEWFVMMWTTWNRAGTGLEQVGATIAGSTQ